MAHRARLGSSAFETIGGAVVTVVLMIGSNVQPEPNGMIAGLNAAQKKGAAEKPCC